MTTAANIRAGFIPIELLVVISIIAILHPAPSSARQTAVTMKCLTQLRDTGTAVDIYALDHNGDFPVSGDVNSTLNINGVLSRWPALIGPFVKKFDKQSSVRPSAPTYSFDHDQCPTRVGVDADSAIGLYGYNVILTNWTRVRPDWGWRSTDQFVDPSGLPLMGDMGGLVTKAGGLHMCFLSPHFDALKLGWSGPVKDNGPAPNHFNGGTNYLDADGQVATRSEAWPGIDFDGNDFHPNGNVNINS